MMLQAWAAVCWHLKRRPQPAAHPSCCITCRSRQLAAPAVLMLLLLLLLLLLLHLGVGCS